MATLEYRIPEYVLSDKRRYLRQLQFANLSIHGACYEVGYDVCMIKIIGNNSDECNEFKNLINACFQETNFDIALETINLVDSTPSQSYCKMDCSILFDLLGRSGHDVKKIENDTGCKIKADKFGYVGLFGTEEAIEKATIAIEEYAKKAGKSAGLSRGDDNPLQYLKMNDLFSEAGNSAFFSSSTFGGSLQKRRIVIDQNFIGAIIGIGGNRKREFEQEFNVKIDIKSSEPHFNGLVPVLLTGMDGQNIDKAADAIMRFIKKLRYNEQTAPRKRYSEQRSNNLDKDEK